MHESFLSHANYRYLRWGLLLSLAAIVAYVLHRADPVPNGGSWLGYTLGAVSALLVVFLLYLGIRKRRYRSALGSLKGWVSAHVWLGLSLLVTATLHTGFQFAWNLHMLAYSLMVAVILSGIWGLVMYARNPALMTDNRQAETRATMWQQLQDLDAEVLQLADDAGQDAQLHHELAEALTPKRPAGFWTRFSNRRWSATAAADYDADRAANSYRIEQAVAAQIAAAGDSQQVELLRQALAVLARRRAVSQQLGRDLQLQAQMELWLLLHVPLSIGLIAALISHIVSVFFYW